MSTTTTTTTDRTDAPGRTGLAASWQRVRGLAGANAKLLVRNRLTLSYGLVMPLLPLALLVAGSTDDAPAIAAISSALMLAWLFAGFYNLLSAVVTRRDELVLKRIRVGETTDRELLLSLALPGAALTAVLAVATLGLATALGVRFPVNLPLYAVVVLAGIVLYGALALWTAAWTRNAEVAQMTSLPVMVLGALGPLHDVVPGRLGDVVANTPGAALDRLLDLAWMGIDGDEVLGFAQTWAAAGQPLLVVAVWVVAAVLLAQHSMRREPRH